jgi:hypothetical protein
MFFTEAKVLNPTTVTRLKDEERLGNNLFLLKRFYISKNWRKK